MTPADVKRYAVEILHVFCPEDNIQCAEIGDGNINYVTRVWSEADGHSVIVKQADKLLRSSGRPLDINRNRLEARMLQLERELAPEFVPEVYRWDETMAAISMEDISAYGNLRK
jgi:5-methylthioribose kinase